MPVSIPSSVSLPKYDSLYDDAPPSYSLPDLPTPEAAEKYLFELIGSSDPENSSAFVDNSGSSEWAAEYLSLLSKGDGNAAVAHIIQGLKEGKLSKEEAIELAKQVQQEANANGGGKINGEIRDALKDALGTDVDHIAKGKTRPQMGFEKFLKGILSIFGL